MKWIGAINMNITSNIDDGVIRASSYLTSKHCRDKDFIELLASVIKYNHTNWTPEDIATGLYNASKNIHLTIEGYKSFNPWSKAIGYAKDRTIYINLRKLYDLDMYERAGNFYHEFCHIVGFQHKGNSVTKYNLETVPYKAGKIFENYLRNNCSQLNANNGSFKL
jgi:hypothetical protein